mgnify:CR=1 FL=1
MTRRKDIIIDLERDSYSVRELIQKYGMLKKEVIEALQHISKSILPKKKLKREHAVCRTCGFVFKNRVRFDTPTKCPKCRGESITEVKFRIR